MSYDALESFLREADTHGWHLTLEAMPEGYFVVLRRDSLALPGCADEAITIALSRQGELLAATHLKVSVLEALQERRLTNWEEIFSVIRSPREITSEKEPS